MPSDLFKKIRSVISSPFFFFNHYKENKTILNNIESDLKAIINNLDAFNMYIQKKDSTFINLKIISETLNRLRFCCFPQSYFKYFLLQNFKYTETYSQSFEDVVVASIFNKLNIPNPSYVDVGAHNPIIINNTLLLHKNGSRGINIEPSDSINEFFIHRKDDINLNIAIGDKEGEADFYIMENKYASTLLEDECLRFQKERNNQMVDVKKIKVDRLENIFKNYMNNTAPDFLSIDTEGMEYAILHSLDYTLYRPSVICVETKSYGKNIFESIINLMNSNNYFEFCSMDVNKIFVKNELREQLLQIKFGEFLMGAGANHVTLFNLFNP